MLSHIANIAKALKVLQVHQLLRYFVAYINTYEHQKYHP